MEGNCEGDQSPYRIVKSKKKKNVSFLFKGIKGEKKVCKLICTGFFIRNAYKMQLIYPFSREKA